MNIKYTDKHNYNKNELEELFLSVGWSSGHFPEKLVIAMKNFETVYSAWDGDRLRRVEMGEWSICGGGAHPRWHSQQAAGGGGVK